MHWFTRSWWRYLLKGCTGWRHFVCRLKGHPCGEVFYNVGGLEPDMHCKGCGDDLG
jgi:hypothetical protein